MKIKTIPLDARLSDADRRLITSAARSHAFERAATQNGLPPIGYGAQKLRLAYTSQLDELDRRLRIAATEAERWQVRLDASFDSVPVPTLYQKAGIVPPPAIRNLSMRNQFYLVRVGGRFAAAGGMKVASLRYTLRFGGTGPVAGRQPVVHAFFPRIGARRYEGTEVLVGLRSTLRFWVAVTPGGALINTADKIAGSVRSDLVFGPVKYNFGQTHVVGAGGGRPSVEWYYPGAAVAGGAKFWNLLVLRMPKGSKSCSIDTGIEANVIMPESLRPLLGRRRLLRDSRHLELRMAGSGR
jgi:hypothetical protein